MGGFGSLAQLGNQSIGQSIGYGIANRQMHDSYDIWKKSLKRGPTYTAIGLEAAGLNRIIAAGGGVTATNAGAMIKANAATGSPGSANPALAQKKGNVAKAQKDALDAAAGASNASALLANTNAEIAAQGLPRAKALAAYYATSAGQGTAIAGEVNSSYPNTITGAGIKGAYNAREIIQRMFSPTDPGQNPDRFPIVPRGNKK